MKAIADVLGDDEIDALLAVLQGAAVPANDQDRARLQAARAAAGAARVAAMKPIFLTEKNKQRRPSAAGPCSKPRRNFAARLTPRKLISSPLG